jgi:hypothetical protein
MVSDPRTVLDRSSTTDEEGDTRRPATLRSVHASTATPRSDRGQLILIAAILIAVVVISSVLLLNTAQSATELRTSQQSQSVTNAGQLSQDVREGLDTVFQTSTSLTEAEATLPYSLDLQSDVETFTEEYRALTNAPGILNISYDTSDTVTGGIVFQTARAEFTDAAGNGDWDVLEDVSSVPTLSARIESVEPSEEFTISISSGSAQLTIENTGPGYTVTRVDGTGTRTCSGLEPSIIIDFHKGVGEVRGKNGVCEGMVLGQGLSSGYTIRFENGDDAEGTYAISGSGGVDGPSNANVYDPNDPFSTPDEPNYRGPGDGSGDDIVVNPAFVVTYDDPDITYQSEYGLYNQTKR